MPFGVAGSSKPCNRPNMHLYPNPVVLRLLGFLGRSSTSPASNSRPHIPTQSSVERSEHSEHSEHSSQLWRSPQTLGQEKLLSFGGEDAPSPDSAEVQLSDSAGRPYEPPSSWLARPCPIHSPPVLPGTQTESS